MTASSEEWTSRCFQPTSRKMKAALDNINRKEKKIRMLKKKSKSGGASKSRLRALLPFLQILKDLSPNQRAIILAHINDSSCEAIYETVSNVLRNKSVSEADARRLRKLLAPHKACLRSLVSNRVSGSQKRKKLYRIGGLPLASILAVGIPLLLSLIRK